MFSPVSVPFTEYEVRRALCLSKDAYTEAVHTGTLARSVHFDGRISLATALHSMVDVVSFDLRVRSKPLQLERFEFASECDWWLDTLCCLDEESDELGRSALAGENHRVLALALPGCVAQTGEEQVATCHDELAVLGHVIDSWCRYYRIFDKVLAADRTRLGAQPLRGWPDKLQVLCGAQ